MPLYPASHRSLASWALLSLAALAAVPMAVPMALAATPAPYRLLRSIRLEGTDGWDYLTLDRARRHLFITRGTHVMVVDPDTGVLLTDLSGMRAVHGVAFAGGRVYISDGGANHVVVVDRRSLKVLGRIAVGQGPDAILYDPFSRRLFTFNGRGADATVIDVQSDKVVGAVALGGKPEAAAADAHGSIFVNLENRSTIAVIDSQTLTVTRGWSVSPCEEPSGIALDIVHGRLFSGCGNALLAVSDTRAGRLESTLPIGLGVDSNRFDAADGLIFSSNGRDGTLTVIQQLAPDRYTVLQNVPTMRSARTMELDPIAHRIYLVGASLQPQSPTPGQPRPRPRVIPGSFRLLILGQ